MTRPEKVPIFIGVNCADSACSQMLWIAWPVDEYASALWDNVVLDGQVLLPKGWWAQPGSEGGDNLVRCPEHSQRKTSTQS